MDGQKGPHDSVDRTLSIEDTRAWSARATLCDVSTLERAIAIAAQAHAGQVDKAGQPYILHPLRVMLRLATEEERIVGVLHDVVEDTPVSLQQLRDEGFSESVLSAVEALTKRDGETRLEAGA